MVNNIPSDAKKHCESTKPEGRQTAKMFFFLSSFSSSSSDGLLQICVTPSQWFSHKTAAFSLSNAPAHRFFPGLKSHEVIRTAH